MQRLQRLHRQQEILIVLIDPLQIIAVDQLHDLLGRQAPTTVQFVPLNHAITMLLPPPLTTAPSVAVVLSEMHATTPASPTGKAENTTGVSL
jgi:hypothetical protein